MAAVIECASVKRMGTRKSGFGKVSAHERVASWLFASVTMGGAGVLVLLCLWASAKLLQPNPNDSVIETHNAKKLGGYKNGVLGESMEIPGPITGELSNESQLVQEPSMDAAVNLVADTVWNLRADLDSPSLVVDEQTAGIGGSRGNGNAPGLGEGGGPGSGVRPGLRWIIRYQQTGDILDYARQLDFLGVELSVMSGTDEVQYASNLASPRPSARTGKREQEERLFFSWRDGGLQAADRILLRNAGIDADSKAVLQFYPKNIEEQLARQELLYLRQKFPGRDFRQVRRTFFAVQSQGSGYVFVVTDQTYF